MHKYVLAFVLLLLCPWLAAQQAMNNDSVVRMAKAGLSDEIIVTTIQSSPGTYDTTTNGLIALKYAGISDKVVSAIITRASGAAPAVAATSSGSAADPDDPASPHDPGVYLYSIDALGKREMAFIDRVGAGREKTTNVLGAAFSYGIAKAKVKAEIPGSYAKIRTKDARPVFYMYFPTAANLGGLGGNDVVTSPSQFALLSLEKKKNHRETAVAKVGFASASAGTDDKHSVLFTANRVKNGIYKLTPNTDLPDGEYAFIASTGMSGSATQHTVVIYDFGVGQ